MPVTLLVPLITQVGLPIAQQLLADWESGKSYTSADFNALIAKYGTETAIQYLAAAGGSPVKAS